MAQDDYESKLQTEIASWNSRSRQRYCNMRFIPEPQQIELAMRGLLWSIQARPLQNPSEYSFNVMHVKRSETPLFTSEAAAANLPAKFELLLQEYRASMESVRRADEALDKLYAFSRLFSFAENDKRWEIVVDAEITVADCESAKEALYGAAQAAAAILLDQANSPVSVRRQQSESSEKSGWWIDKWKVADELWATGFFPPDSWKCSMRMIQAKAVENGDVAQWCRVRTFDEPSPNFQFEVAVHEFLEGDKVLLRIGVANDRPLTVRVFLKESVEVVCSQEGLETGTSLGLAYLLPDLVKDYIKSSLRESEEELRNKNVVQSLLQHLIKYLAFLGQICVICGNNRPSHIVAWKSSCRDICKATKQRYKDAIARVFPEPKILEQERRSRREKYVKSLYRNSKEGRRELGFLLKADVVDEEETKDCKDENAIDYRVAVEMVAEMEHPQIS